MLLHMQGLAWIFHILTHGFVQARHENSAYPYIPRFVLCRARTSALRWARLNNQSRHAQNNEHCYRNSICLHSTQHITVVYYIR